MTENPSPASAEEPVPIALLDAAFSQRGGSTGSPQGTGPWPYLAAGGRRLEPTVGEDPRSTSKEERG
jgi:hypothetical protein